MHPIYTPLLPSRAALSAALPPPKRGIKRGTLPPTYPLHTLHISPKSAQKGATKPPADAPQHTRLPYGLPKLGQYARPWRADFARSARRFCALNAQIVRPSGAQYAPFGRPLCDGYRRRSAELVLG